MEGRMGNGICNHVEHSKAGKTTQKRLALTKDGKLTYCSASEENIGKGRCNHIAHQKAGESMQSFMNRANEELYKENVKKHKPLTDQEMNDIMWNVKGYDGTTMDVGEEYFSIESGKWHVKEEYRQGLADRGVDVDALEYNINANVATRDKGGRGFQINGESNEEALKRARYCLDNDIPNEIFNGFDEMPTMHNPTMENLQKYVQKRDALKEQKEIKKRLNDLMNPSRSWSGNENAIMREQRNLGYIQDKIRKIDPENEIFIR